MEVKELFRSKGVPFFLDSPTNQQFPVLTDAQIEYLNGKVAFEIWEKLPDGRTVTRFATSWATGAESVAELGGILNEMP